ncbi:hypothetical protein ACK3SF_01665 [Candidatus Nanosalina sp. VS9-1]|uniref:hypothetical protein n=1 Tax=Candidatus Nanosalina sp. VS9-1 TaxID=3388566 RepID=UPI0039E10AEF
MSRQGKPPVDFSIDYSGEIFPSREEKEAFGFRPLDVFLVDEVDSDDVLEPRVVFYGDSGEELVEDMEKDLLLASRYVLEDFDLDNSVSVPWDADSYPVIQRELSPASVEVSDDFRGLMQILDEGFDDFDAEFMYKMTTRQNGNVNRFMDVDSYTKHVSTGPVTVWPETFGVNSVTVFPQSFKAMITLYEQEVTAPRNEEEMRKHGIGGDEYWETIHLDYDEEPINALESSLQRQGLGTERDYLPPSVVPEEFR